MVKNEFIKKIAEKTEMTQKDTEFFYDAMLDVIGEEMNKETNTKVSIPNFGTLNVSLKKSHTSKNPKTQEKLVIPDKRYVRMSISAHLKNRLKQPK